MIKAPVQVGPEGIEGARSGAGMLRSVPEGPPTCHLGEALFRPRVPHKLRGRQTNRGTAQDLITAT
jgi:hypothetical protein